MSLIEHLRELRNRLAVSLAALAVGVVVSYVFFGSILGFLTEPYCRTEQARETGCQLFAFAPLQEFSVRLRVSLLGGVIATAPVWLYQLGAFITPGLRRHERRWAFGFLVASLSLFLLGVGMAYVTIDRGLDFLLGIGGDDITSLIDVSRYISFVTLTLLAFGVAFEFPVVVLFLHLVGLMPLERMRAWRRGVIMGIAVFTAVITPSQDPITFLAMAVPMWLMYEGCVVVARVRERSQRRREAAAGLLGLGDDEASPLDSRPSSVAG